MFPTRRLWEWWTSKLTPWGISFSSWAHYPYFIFVNSLDGAEFSPITSMCRSTSSSPIKVSLDIIIHLKLWICLYSVHTLWLIGESLHSRDICILHCLVVALVTANTLNSSNSSPSLNSLVLLIFGQKFLRDAFISSRPSNEHIVFDSVVCTACDFI